MPWCGSFVTYLGLSETNFGLLFWGLGRIGFFTAGSVFWDEESWVGGEYTAQTDCYSASGGRDSSAAGRDQSDGARTRGKGQRDPQHQERGEPRAQVRNPHQITTLQMNKQTIWNLITLSSVAFSSSTLTEAIIDCAQPRTMVLIIFRAACKGQAFLIWSLSLLNAKCA